MNKENSLKRETERIESLLLRLSDCKNDSKAISILKEISMFAIIYPSIFIPAFKRFTKEKLNAIKMILAIDVWRTHPQYKQVFPAEIQVCFEDHLKQMKVNHIQTPSKKEFSLKGMKLKNRKQ